MILVYFGNGRHGAPVSVPSNTISAMDEVTIEQKKAGDSLASFLQLATMLVCNMAVRGFFYPKVGHSLRKC